MEKSKDTAASARGVSGLRYGLCGAQGTGARRFPAPFTLHLLRLHDEVVLSSSMHPYPSPAAWVARYHGLVLDEVARIQALGAREEIIL